MVIAFLVLRDTTLRILGPLIDESLKDNKHRVIVFYQEGYNVKAKAYQDFTPRKSPKFEFGIPEFVEYRPEWLENICQKYKVNCLITEEGYGYFYKYLDILIRTKKRGVKVISLCSFFDILTSPSEALEYFDKTYYISEFLKNIHFLSIIENEKEKKYTVEILEDKYKGKYEISGTPAWDQLLKKVDRKEIKRKYGIADGKKIVLFTPPPISSSELWRFIVWGSQSRLIRTYWAFRNKRLGYLSDIWKGPSFKDMVKAMKRFCRENDTLFVIKNRVKSSHYNYMVKLSDIYIYGYNEEYYPISTTYQLLLISDLCIANYSFSLLEAVIAGIPALCIHGGSILDYTNKTKEYIKWDELVFNNKSDSLFNYIGCINNIDYHCFPDWFGKTRLNDFQIDNQRRSSYINRFANIVEGGQTSSQYIIRSVENLQNI